MAELRVGDINDPDEEWEDYANGQVHLGRALRCLGQSVDCLTQDGF